MKRWGRTDTATASCRSDRRAKFSHVGMNIRLTSEDGIRLLIVTVPQRRLNGRTMEEITDPDSSTNRSRDSITDSISGATLCFALPQRCPHVESHSSPPPVSLLFIHGNFMIKSGYRSLTATGCGRGAFRWEGILREHSFSSRFVSKMEFLSRCGVSPRLDREGVPTGKKV